MNWRTHFSGDYDVAAIQKALNAQGADPQVTVDGSYGPLTKAAVIAFQQSKGLTADGIVGPLTANALGITDTTPSEQPTIPGGKVAVPAFPGFVALSSNEQRAFVKAAQRIAPGERDAPRWLAGVVEFETDRSWSPSKRNPTSGAVGLIQFLPRAWGAAAASWPSANELAAMSFIQQLEYVVRYFAEISRTQGRIHSLTDMYLSVFAPKGVGRSPDTVLFSAGEKGYDQNSHLDHGDKGYITVGDAANAPNARLAAVSHLSPVMVSMGIGIASLLLLVGAGAAWYYRKRLFG